MTATDYGHVAFLLLRCIFHPDVRAIALNDNGSPICRDCVEASLAD